MNYKRFFPARSIDAVRSESAESDNPDAAGQARPLGGACGRDSTILTEPRTDDPRVPGRRGPWRHGPLQSGQKGLERVAIHLVREGPLRHSYAILEAPSALGHIPEHRGVERAPGVLLEAGLADGLSARRAGCLPAGGYSSVPDPRTKVMNPQPLHDYSRLLADRIEAILGNGEFPVVLGGDCSLLLGAALALRRRGRYGVLYVDGDADFYQPEVNPLRGAASASDLAFATGRGPDIVCDLEGRRPLVRDGDVAVLACRDAAARERRGCQPLPRDMLVLDREHARQAGAA